jgi:hypothetical protein
LSFAITKSPALESNQCPDKNLIYTPETHFSPNPAGRLRLDQLILSSGGLDLQNRTPVDRYLLRISGKATVVNIGIMIIS